MYKFSPSTLNLLKDCPRCFWLQFKKDIKRPVSIFPSLPSGIDKKLKEYFDFFIENKKIPPEIKSLEGVKLFDNLELLNVWRNNFKGIQWKDTSGNILHGAIDALLVKENKLIVLDFKTRGFPLKDDTHEHYQDQLDLYNFLLRKNNHQTEDHSYLLFYYPDKINSEGNVKFHTELVKIRVSIENAERILNKAIQVLNSEMPSASENCTFCKWAEKINQKS